MHDPRRIMDGSSRRARAPQSRMPEFASLAIDRRRFLVLVGGAAALAALPPTIVEAARRVASVPTGTWTLPESMPAGAIESARALIGASILAPSFWNAQPWRFEVDPAELRLTLDPARALPGCDPDQRFTQMSLGAALENLLVAARAWGQQPTVQYLPWGPAARAGSPLVVARVSWMPGEAHRDRAMFQAIPWRRTNPRHYDGRAIAGPDRAQMQAQVPEDLGLRWLDDRNVIRRVAKLVREATWQRARDRVAQRDRLRWLRYSTGDARRTADGVTPDQLGLAGPLGWLAARALAPGHHAFAWGAGSVAHEAEDAVRSAGALALITAPAKHDATFLVAGQAYQRLALKATSLHLAQQPLSAPVESEEHRTGLAQLFGATGEEPLLLVRLGHAHAPAPTPRRAVAVVSTFRAS